MDRKVLEKMNYGVFVVGTTWQGKRVGCVVNSFAQVTSNLPQKFTITLNRDNETCKALLESRSFAVTLAGKDCPKELVNLFGYKSGRVVNKFEGIAVEEDGNGNPYIPDHALARFACKIVDRLDLGSYVLYIAEATEAEVLGEGLALTLDDFRDAGNTTPPTAPVIRVLEKEEGWKCTVCGYIAEKETLPDGYRCPLCRAPKDKFEKL